MWRWFWRLIGLAALILSIVSCFFLYALWKASAVRPVVNGEPASSLEVVSLQIDILSLVIAVVGIALAVMGFIGYQAIKSGAEAVAIQTAEAKADEIATRAVALHMQNIPGTDGSTQALIEPDEVSELTEEEKGD